MYELVICWDGGEKSVYEYPDMISAERAEADMVMALGNQIFWTCVRKKIQF